MGHTSQLQKQAEKLARSAHESSRPDVAVAKILTILLRDARAPEIRAARDVVKRLKRVTGSMRLAPSTTLRRAILRAKSSEDTLENLRQRARTVLMGEGMVSSEDVSALLGSTSVNPRQYAMELRNRGELLGVKRGNRYWYPEFQFDRTRQTVYDVVREVMQLLDANEDPWGVLSWWVSPNARVTGQRAPKDLLVDASQHGALLALARTVVEDSG
jgi:hypothetical protein